MNIEDTIYGEDTGTVTTDGVVTNSTTTRTLNGCGWEVQCYCGKWENCLRTMTGHIVFKTKIEAEATMDYLKQSCPGDEFRVYESLSDHQCLIHKKHCCLCGSISHNVSCCPWRTKCQAIKPLERSPFNCYAVIGGILRLTTRFHMCGLLRPCGSVQFVAR